MRAVPPNEAQAPLAPGSGMHRRHTGDGWPPISEKARAYGHIRHRLLTFMCANRYVV